MQSTRPGRYVAIIAASRVSCKEMSRSENFHTAGGKGYSERKFQGRCNASNEKTSSQHVLEGLLHQGVCGKGAEDFA